MRYFHRTSLAVEHALEEADRFFAGRLATAGRGARTRAYTGPMGRIEIAVRAEGGHYTLVTVTTDQLGESEADKLAKRFLSVLHTRVHPEHEVRGAY